MKFSIGYSLIDSFRFNETVDTFRKNISEIYFAWPGTPSGRSGAVKDEAELSGKIGTLLEDLEWYSSMGLPLVILLNGNCYGADAVSRELAESTARIIETVYKTAGSLKSVTTASPFLALKIKERFPELQIRASVNMKISDPAGMEYLSDRFDFFYIAKELNRNIEEIRRLRKWAFEHNKEIGMLVNSGCLNFCSNQVFHDNLVAHEADIRDFNPEYYQPVQCRKFLAERKNWKHLLCSSNWIRPEDLKLYEGLFEFVKLATRMHSNPYMVLAAYSSGRHRGNILDLTEPGFSGITAPEIIENESFSEGWSARQCSPDEAEEMLPRLLRNVDYGILDPVNY